MASSPLPYLVFGLEMESLIRPRSRNVFTNLAQRNWDDEMMPCSNSTKDTRDHRRNRSIMREQIAYDLQRNNVRAISGEAALDTEDFRQWTIADESSLNEVGDFWRVEFVSRAFLTTENWQVEVDKVFEVLQEDWEIHLTHGCSMHVHVSPGIMVDGFMKGQRYTIEHLRRLVKAIALFDDATTKIMPRERKENPWAESNFQGSKVPIQLKQLYSLVPAQTWAPLFNRIDQLKWPNLVFQALGENRYLSWNFSNISDSGTVEFRRPPGVINAVQAKHWVAVALGFVSSALGNNMERYTNFNHYLRIDELLPFLQSGIQRLAPTCGGALRHERIREDLSNPYGYTSAEMQDVERKKLEKKESPFAVKVSSRPNSPASRVSGSRSAHSSASGSSPGARSHTSNGSPGVRSNVPGNASSSSKMRPCGF
ncbi:hypothetical protein F4808DRAFT_473724 [Astrocystis sublimbata]|nr:hypothetical protein F4808DRAFT_473724 [Astrocystis sublimbata]